MRTFSNDALIKECNSQNTLNYQDHITSNKMKRKSKQNEIKRLKIDLKPSKIDTLAKKNSGEEKNQNLKTNL